MWMRAVDFPRFAEIVMPPRVCLSGLCTYLRTYVHKTASKRYLLKTLFLRKVNSNICTYSANKVIYNRITRPYTPDGTWIRIFRLFCRCDDHFAKPFFWCLLIWTF
jgi:hypothetical protein